jgi:hypothetical protein
MAKKKSVLMKLVTDRYFLWSIVFVTVVTTGLLTQIAVSAMDIQNNLLAEQNYQVIQHNAHPAVTSSTTAHKTK